MAQVEASSIFGSNLPNMDNMYFIADYTTGARMTNVGQNNFTVSNSNMQAATVTTTLDGLHNHNYVDFFFAEFTGGGANNQQGSASSDSDNSPTTNRTGTTTNQGNHTHNLTIGTGSPSSIDNRPVSKKMYAFVFLGE